MTSPAERFSFKAVLYLRCGARGTWGAILQKVLTHFPNLFQTAEPLAATGFCTVLRNFQKVFKFDNFLRIVFPAIAGLAV
jgi:hypothetical protein